MPDHWGLSEIKVPQNPLADHEFPFQIFKQAKESNMLSGIFNFQIPSREQGLTPVLRDNSLEQSK